MGDKGWEQYVQPTSEWLDGFKRSATLDDMLIDIWLLGDKDFVIALEALCESLMAGDENEGTRQ